jgi:hypothetical protein
VAYESVFEAFLSHEAFVVELHNYPNVVYVANVTMKTTVSVE